MGSMHIISRGLEFSGFAYFYVCFIWAWFTCSYYEVVRGKINQDFGGCTIDYMIAVQR
jgi:hypothetical protein